MKRIMTAGGGINDEEKECYLQAHELGPVGMRGELR